MASLLTEVLAAKSLVIHISWEQRNSRSDLTAWHGFASGSPPKHETHFFGMFVTGWFLNLSCTVAYCLIVLLSKIFHRAVITFMICVGVLSH